MRTDRGLSALGQAEGSDGLNDQRDERLGRGRVELGRVPGVVADRLIVAVELQLRIGGVDPQPVARDLPRQPAQPLRLIQYLVPADEYRRRGRGTLD